MPVRVRIYSAVLPWSASRSHAPQLVRDGESADDVFVRILREQAADIARLRHQYQPDVMIWAGDFNQTVTGPNRGGSRVKRAALLDALATLDLGAWNGEADHAKPDLRAIDLKCGSRDQSLVRQGRIDPVADGVVMSDHAGYWVDL